MQLLDFTRRGSKFELSLQYRLEQMMVAKPPPLGIERDGKKIVVLQEVDKRLAAQFAWRLLTIGAANDLDELRTEAIENR